MKLSPLLLLVVTVGGVGILHTIVPDHWAPIAIIARQRHWSRRQTALAAARAGLGHSLSTVAIGIIAWIAGTITAARLGHVINLAAGIALVGFGLWTMIEGWRESRAPIDVSKPSQEIARRTTLLLVLGSSPSVECIPAFLASVPYGFGAFVALSVVFTITTVATYVATCTLSHVSLEQLKFPGIERYGEVASGAFVALIGLVFLIWLR